MKAPLWLGSLSVVLLVGCSSGSDTSVPQTPTTQPTVPQTAPLKDSLLTQPRQSGLNSSVPGLLQPTNAKARANTVVTGRRDPFAALPTTSVPIVVSSSAAPKKVAVTPLPSGASVTGRRLPSLPLPSTPPQTASLPNLGSIPLPPIPVSSAPSFPAPPPSRTALADGVQVSGVVQVGGRWNVIIKEPTASSSRYVAVGDYIENGRVLVKTILAPGGTDPIVVLQQDGIEVRKSLV